MLGLSSKERADLLATLTTNVDEDLKEEAVIDTTQIPTLK
jgi:hypothetical protein